ncbi:MAG: hypothetical protein PF518_11835 [Spirochaetaceae bacterium]|nr:hypothetical protein [Spirochaetaceae bacterium]
MDTALFSALKIPTGSMERVSGSGYFDLGFSILMVSFYLQNGLVIPGQLFSTDLLSPELIYSFVTAFEFIVSPVFSLVTQFRFNTSPIKEGSVVPENISFSVKLHQPMTNILFGAVFMASGYRIQVNFEEDAFTNNGADLIMNFTVSKSFSTK